MPRKEFTAKTKRAAWTRSGGCCESALVPQLADIGCNRRLHPGDIRYEHIDPDGLTGEPTLENCAVLCVPCWRIKTVRYDIPQVARAKRKADAHLGIKRTSRPMPYGKDSEWKKTMSGKVVRR